MSKLGREIAFRTNVKRVTTTRVITVGPETAAKMGVPVGTQIEQTVMWHRNPLKQLMWRLKTRDFKSRVNNPSGLISGV